MGNFAETLKKNGIDFLLTFVGLIDTYLSVYYTFQWHLYTGDPWFEGLTYAFVVVIFAIIIFEFAVRMAITTKHNGKMHWSTFVLFTLWLLVVSYSMQSTVAGTYLGTMKTQIATIDKQTTARTAGVKAQMLKEEVDQIDTEIASYEKRKAQLEGLLSTVDTVEKMYEWKKTTGTVQTQWDEINEELKSAREKRATASEELRQATLEAKVEELKGAGTDVFAFYSRVLHIEDTSIVQFVLAVFKGIILDLINVICFMLVMLREKWSKEEEHEEQQEIRKVMRDRGKRTEKAIDTFADLVYGETRSRNGLVPSYARAREIGVSKPDYERIIERGLLRGIFVRRKHKVYRNKSAEMADFLEETKDL